MKANIFLCDGCGRQKGETNHWFKFRDYPDVGNGAEFIVNDWKDQSQDYETTKHLCSDSCVVKTVQAWLSAQKEISQKEV